MEHNNGRYIIYDGSKDVKHVNNLFVYNNGHEHYCDTCECVHGSAVVKIRQLYKLCQWILIVRANVLTVFNTITKEPRAYPVYNFIDAVVYDDKMYIWKIYGTEIGVIRYARDDVNHCLDVAYEMPEHKNTLVPLMRHYEGDPLDFARVIFPTDLMATKNKAGIKYVPNYRDIIFVYQ